MNWLMVIILTYDISGVAVTTVPYKSKLDCEVASLSVLLMDDDNLLSVKVKCVIGSGE